MSARDVLARARCERHWRTPCDMAGCTEFSCEWRKGAEVDLAALSAAGLVVEQGWQPIETAPRDGNKWGPWVRLYQPGFVPLSGRWFHDSASRGWWVAAGGPFNPTHWRPIEPLPRRRTSDDGS